MKAILGAGCWLATLSLVSLGCSSSHETPAKHAARSATKTTTPKVDTADAGDTPVCGNTNGLYAGDDLCILPPPPDQGFQVHYGPADYDDPSEVGQYLLDPGGETNLFVPTTSGNTTDIYYYKRQYRLRPGSHHLIISEGSSNAGFAAAGRRLGGSQNPSKDNPDGPPAPENAGIGIPLKANDPLTINIHNFNQTDHPILKEAWVNFWYVDPSTVTQQANELFLFAPGQSVPPGGHVTFSGKKTISDATRVLTMYGHRHSSTIRFTAYLTHAGNKQTVLQDFNWEEPAVFEFNSVTTNPTPDPASQVAGAVSGDLNMAPGDLLEWECEVVNNSTQTITYGLNEVAGSEMCIVVGDLIGPTTVGFSD
jgi:hypothetical protein